MSYAIKHKETGLLFSGFGPAPDYEARWSDKRAVVWDKKEHAQAQAYLFRSQGLSPQIKPVAA